jgi:hypothetical protein
LIFVCFFPYQEVAEEKIGFGVIYPTGQPGSGLFVDILPQAGKA